MSSSGGAEAPACSVAHIVRAGEAAANAGDPLVVPLGAANDQQVAMRFRWIPPGEFLMGSRGHDSTEEPRHRVVISRGFWLGELPVTQGQYAALTGADRSQLKGARRPVEGVSWGDAIYCCEALNRRLSGGQGQCAKLLESGEQTTHRVLPAASHERAPTWPEGHHASLPTEAQWEYACRAGTTTDYYTGDGEAALREAGWYSENAGGETHAMPLDPLDGPDLAANAWGLRHMHGNVSEWCRDVWNRHAYAERPASCSDPWKRLSPDGDEHPDRVVRGGAWGNPAGHCRSATRIGRRPGLRSWLRGFRVGLFPGPSSPDENE